MVDGDEAQAPVLMKERQAIAIACAWLRFATSSSARFGAAALTKCAKHSLRHP
jgi:hypothetical protein